jgi:hypothetical protein
MAETKKEEIRPYLFKLFIIIALPIHIWSIFQTFNNAAWVASRTRWWDALGYGAYAQMYALIESFLIFLVAVPFFFMLKKNRTSDKALAVIAFTYLAIVALWVFRAIMINRTADEFFLDSYINHLADEGKWRKRYRYGAVLLASGLLGLPVVLAAFLSNRAKKAEKFVLSLIDRFEILMYLFLTLDVAGIVLVIIRNIQGAA